VLVIAHLLTNIDKEIKMKKAFTIILFALLLPISSMADRYTQKMIKILLLGKKRKAIVLL